MLRNLLDWLEDRTGLPSAVQHFLDEDIPASAGWHQVLGSMALFGFLCQVVTGLLLAFNYAPTPSDAHSSVRYIMNELTGGPLIRGIHHWGASVMIVVVGLHMAQVLIWGAYRKPREATWLVGLVLLQIVLAFGLTGYLLPWDNRAYWGTVVTTQIAAKAPGAGVYILRLMGVEDGIVGAVTFARFYTLHVMLLPLVTAVLIAAHVYLVRRHGVTPQPGDEAKPKKKFFPGQVYKDTVAMFLMFALLIGLSIAAKAPLGRLADPTDTHYIPRPEWYFLFLFQTLKFFEGPLEIIGSMVLPGIAMGFLAALPFLDRGVAKRVSQRTTAILGVLLAGLVWAGLTAAAIMGTPKQVADDGLVELQEWQKSGPKAVAEGAVPAPEAAKAGALIYQAKNCGVCHTVAGEGKRLGPELNGLRYRREREWVKRHFLEPQKYSPGSTMPTYRLPESELSQLTDYLMGLE